MRIKTVPVALLIFTLFACTGPTKKELEEEKKISESARINTELAVGYIQRGDIEIAEKKLKLALKQDENYVPALITMAVLMMMSDKQIEAENYYLEALDIDPHDPLLHNNYGTFLCKIGKYQEAVNEFKKSLRNQFYRTPEAAHANIGYCLMQFEKPNYKLAERHLRLALKKNNTLKTALLAMAELGIKTKNYLMTRAYMQRYHSVTDKNAYSLWLQIQAEHALGDKEYFLKISRELLDEYPDSIESEKIMGLSNL